MPPTRKLVLAEDLYAAGQTLKARNAVIPAEPTNGLWRRDMRIGSEPELVEWAPGRIELCVWIITEQTWYRWSLTGAEPEDTQPWPLSTVWVEV